MSENIVTLAEHIVIPHQADWTRKPELNRMWRSSVDNALGGGEDRLSVRSAAWMRLRYQVFPFDHVESARFDCRMRAALKAGKIAAPLWGRGVPIAEEATIGHESVVLNRANHALDAGKYVFIQPSIPAEFDTFDLCLIDAVEGARIHFSEPLENYYARGTRVWPLLFGKPIPETFQLGRRHGHHTVTLQFDGRQINATAEDDFESYDVGPFTELNDGEGWSSPWVFGEYAA